MFNISRLKVQLDAHKRHIVYNEYKTHKQHKLIYIRDYGQELSGLLQWRRAMCEVGKNFAETSGNAFTILL
jgi:hypothetical protein